MELELKHIYGYIIHGLHAMIQDVICEIEGVDLVWKSTVIAERVNYKLSEIKPILRPLSDINKEIEVNGEKFVPIEKLRSLFSGRLMFDGWSFYNLEKESLVNKGGEKQFPFNQLDAFEYLFKWHIDIYELIENGLAIDMNKL